MPTDAKTFTKQSFYSTLILSDFRRHAVDTKKHTEKKQIA